MSEKLSNIIEANLPEDLASYDKLDMMTYKNGAKHAYGVDNEGKRSHISNDDILEAYGYDPNDSNSEAEPSAVAAQEYDAPKTEYATDDVVKLPSLKAKNKGELKEYRIKSITDLNDKYGGKGVILESLDGSEEQHILYSALQSGAQEGPIQDGSVESNLPAVTEALKEDYIDKLKNTVNGTRTDGPVLDESARLRRKLGIETPVDKEESTGFEIVDTSEEESYSNRLKNTVGGVRTDGKPLDESARLRRKLGIETPADESTSSSTEIEHVGNEYGYQGPVEPGSEIELAGPTDIEVFQPPQAEIVQNIEVDPALIEHLDQMRTKYAESTAKVRKSHLGRFLKQDTQLNGLLGKSKLLGRAVNAWNSVKSSKVVSGASEYLDKNVFEREHTENQKAYEAAYNALSVVTAEELKRVGWEEDTVQALSRIGNITQDLVLESEIVQFQEEKGGNTNKFVNWWVSQSGFKGKLLKAGLVVTAGAATGLTAGMFLGATASMIAGGVVGERIASHVTHRRANSIDESGKTLAQRKSEINHEMKTNSIDGRHDDAEEGGFGSVEDITGRTENSSTVEKVGNRNRKKTATALGLTAAKAALRIRDMFDSNSPTEAPKQPQPEKPKAQPEAPKTPEAPQPAPKAPEVINGRQFNVEQGNGFTHEIQDFAQANGKSVDGQKAFDIYNEAVARFGKDGMIDKLDTYNRVQGDIGIASPGSAQWKPGVAEFINSKLQ